MSAEDSERFVIRCRGLPWSTTVDEIVNFFEDISFKDGSDSVHLTLTREGRPSGEAYIELSSQEDLDKALEKDKQHMGKRYIEVFKSKYSEMEWVVKRSSKEEEQKGAFGTNDNVVRLRGLPFDCTKADVSKFFEGLDITNNGILLTTDYQGRMSGEAYVQFATKEHAERALEKNKESIGHRYIEVFRSSLMEAQRAQYGGGYGGRGGRGRDYGGYGGRGGRPGPYDRMGGPPLGRGFGYSGPGARGPRGPMKGFGNDRGYGGGGYDDDYGYANDRGFDDYRGGYEGGFGGDRYGMGMGGGNGSMGGMGGGFGMSGGGGGGGGSSHVVHMRGLPFRVTENDIAEWFSSVVDPVEIQIQFNNQGRPTGEADVFFDNEADAKKAMSKDRQNMQHRYIELFYDGTSMKRGRAGGMGGGGGGFGARSGGYGMGMSGGGFGSY